MYIHDTVSGFISMLVESRQTYRCLVDGQDGFRGEILPVGTKSDVLSWIGSRYKVIGELFVIGDDAPWRFIIYNAGALPLRREAWLPAARVCRYLVEVDGIEKMFVLQPVPIGFLEWRPVRQVTMKGA